MFTRRAETQLLELEYNGAPEDPEEDPPIVTQQPPGQPQRHYSDCHQIQSWKSPPTLVHHYSHFAAVQNSHRSKYYVGMLSTVPAPTARLDLSLTSISPQQTQSPHTTTHEVAQSVCQANDYAQSQMTSTSPPQASTQHPTRSASTNDHKLSQVFSPSLSQDGQTVPAYSQTLPFSQRAPHHECIQHRDQYANQIHSAKSRADRHYQIPRQVHCLLPADILKRILMRCAGSWITIAKLGCSKLHSSFH